MPLGAPASSTEGRRLRRLPRLLGGAVRLSWGAAPGTFGVSVGLQVVGSAALGAQILLARRLFTILLADNHTGHFASIIPVIALLTGALAVSRIVATVRTELQRLLAELVARKATTRVIGAAASADLLQFEVPGFHDRLERATINAATRPLQMTSGLLGLGGAVLSASAVGAALLTIAPVLVGLAVLAVIPLTLISARVGRALYDFAVAQTPTDRRRIYLQSLMVRRDPAKELRAYDLGLWLRREHAALYQVRIDALKHLVRRRMVQGAGAGLLSAVVSVGAMGLLVLLVSEGRISLGAAGAAAAALLALGAQMASVAASVGQLYECSLFIQDFDDFVRDFPEAQSVAAHAPSVEIGVGDIRARNLTFTYPSRHEPSVAGVDVDIRHGEVVALVGANGSGKTTLAKLLAGLYPPSRGLITWNGIEITDLPPETVRDRVAVLFQDFVTYAFSARDNITVGRWRENADLRGAELAAEQAGAAEFITALPQGYDTPLASEFMGGSDLSGGQWQRLALARAFFRNADLVILDEPTSALDPRSEAALFASVRELFTGRSVLLISHRFATVRHADHIYVLDQGRVIEHGDHPTLMAADGTYAELFSLQAAAFGLEPR